MSYRNHIAAAQRAAVREGIPENIVEGRLCRFESLCDGNPRIPQQLEEVGLLASACSRIATGSKFETVELDQRLAQNSALDYHQKVEAKLCLLNLGLMDARG